MEMGSFRSSNCRSSRYTNTKQCLTSGTLYWNRSEAQAEGTEEGSTLSWEDKTLEWLRENFRNLYKAFFEVCRTPEFLFLPKPFQWSLCPLFGPTLPSPFPASPCSRHNLDLGTCRHPCRRRSVTTRFSPARPSEVPQRIKKRHPAEGKGSTHPRGGGQQGVRKDARNVRRSQPAPVLPRGQANYGLL
jgi:hypothetical protein